MDDMVSAPASGAILGIPEEVLPKLRGWFNAVPFVVGKPSLLYEDTNVRLSIQFEYRAHQGRIVIFVNNLGNDDLNDVKFDIPSIDYLKITVTQDVGSKINFGEQSRYILGLECLKPFADAPEMAFSFKTRSNSYSYALRLPVTAACFFEPAVLDKASYMARWKSLEGNVCELK